MLEEIVKSAQDRMQKAIEALRRDLATVRAGRATPAMLDKVMVEYYGTQMPVNQVSTVSVPEPRQLLITPWDKGMLSEIEKAIQKSDLGLNPMNDGSVIRLVIPPLTDERRQELAKVVRRMAEEARIAIRNVRRDANDELKRTEKAGDVSEDEVRRGMDKIQQLTDKFVGEVDKMLEVKERELKEI
ncbi:MAG: ribosome recycling factor [Alicyclobacillus herbarius]|uniref:ribosome recycling factor n=1 Tax=Alicyclobacillus herbarius TaxID=122960 RepID=UPI00041F3F13|nr:ribosome recycling factor [Alicyclobacillus herbarius]MCL6632004.1 ribosome recycling factor [Alicyclobacillus herbarius]